MLNKLLHGIVASSLLLSLSLPTVAMEATTQTASPIQTQTLYNVYYDSRTVKDFLDYNGDFSGISPQVGAFDSTQGELYRSRAENRVVVHSILEQLLTPGMSETETVKAIYDFPIFNFIRNDTTRETLPDAIYHTPYDRDMVNIVDCGTWLLSVGTGGCQEFSYLLNRLLNTAGIPAINAYGNYVNRDGSSQWHAWNRAKVDGVWYWYDVDVEGSVYKRGDVSWPIYYLYQKDSADWTTNHTWDASTYDNLVAKVDSSGYLPAGTLFSYDMPVEVSFNGINFNTDHHIYGLVDLDCDEWNESISLLPFHDTLNYLGVSTYYNSEVGCLVAEEGGNRYEFFPDSYTCWQNGTARNLASSLKTIDGVDYISSDDIMLLLDYEYNLQYYSNNGVPTAVVMFQGGKSNTQPGTTPSISTPTTPGTSAPSTGNAPAVFETATPSTVKVTVDGKEVAFGPYHIDGFNYFKLTDLAYALDDSGSEFLVSWDMDLGAVRVDTGKRHMTLGNELEGNSGAVEMAELLPNKTLVNGEEEALLTYIIQGSSYVQLESIREILGFDVAWNGETSTISITSR